MPNGLYSPERLIKSLRQRLSLRIPQAEAVKILADIVENYLDLSKDSDPAAQLEIIQEAYPEIEDFERDFPSLCFALATGVGKTRLMGAFIAYLFMTSKSRHFFVIAPSTTIYQKLITDFTPGTAKYVFKGLSSFDGNPPVIITGEDWQRGEIITASEQSQRPVINIFNVDKFNRDDGRIRQLQETLGQSYFSYLSALPDLVILMDEAHRYRAHSGLKAISELKPVLGLELTATPKNTQNKGQDFKNIIYSYKLAAAIRNGLVKSPVAVTLENFDPRNYDSTQLEHRKLFDAVQCHEEVKAELIKYAKETKQPLVHPFILVVAQNTAHATEIKKHIQSDNFYGGRFKDKVIEVHSKQKGVESDEATRKLLELEATAETEIVIHVNKLKEGWDVSNLFTIVPLRASASDILTEQTLGRGLRLPYSKPTGNKTIDSLSLVAHDRFSELIEASKQPGSIIMGQKLLSEDNTDLHNRAVNIPSVISGNLAGKMPFFEDGQPLMVHEEQAQYGAKTSLSDKKVFCETIKVIRENAEETCKNGLSELNESKMRHIVLERVRLAEHVQNAEADANLTQPVETLVQQCIDEVVEHTIEIPEIIIAPKQETSFQINDFDLTDLDKINHQPVEDRLLGRDLTNQNQSVTFGKGEFRSHNIDPTRYLVDLLAKKNDLDYEEDGPLLKKLADQLVAHLKSYLNSPVEVNNVVVNHKTYIADFIYRQITANKSGPPVDYEATVKKGFKLLRPQIVTGRNDCISDFRNAVNPVSDTPKYIFTGFKKCGYPAQKFQSNPERQFAVLLEDETRAEVVRWMKPAQNQFSITYADGKKYNPDFVIETSDEMIVAEIKAPNQINTSDVQSKKDAMIMWITHVNAINKDQSKKQWTYLLIDSSKLDAASTLNGLKATYKVI